MISVSTAIRAGLGAGALALDRGFMLFPGPCDLAATETRMMKRILTHGQRAMLWVICLILGCAENIPQEPVDPVDVAAELAPLRARIAQLETEAAVWRARLDTLAAATITTPPPPPADPWRAIGYGSTFGEVFAALGEPDAQLEDVRGHVLRIVWQHSERARWHVGNLLPVTVLIYDTPAGRGAVWMAQTEDGGKMPPLGVVNIVPPPDSRSSSY